MQILQNIMLTHYKFIQEAKLLNRPRWKTQTCERELCRPSNPNWLVKTMAQFQTSITLLQTKMVKIYTPFQTKKAKKPYP